MHYVHSELIEDFIQVPLVIRSGPPMPEFIRVGLTELAAPLPDGFIGYDNPTGAQELFHIAVAETEAVIQPDAVADDFGREAVVLIAVGGHWCVHTTSMSHAAVAEQVDNAVTIEYRANKAGVVRAVT
jgi:hypothetical protein